MAVTAGTKEKSGRIALTPTGVHTAEKLALMAWALRPTRMPRRISAMRERVLAEVKTFWITFPSFSPRVFR